MTWWSRSAGDGSALSSRAGIDAMPRISVTPVDLTTFQNRDTLNRRMTTTAPPQRSAASTCQPGSA